ncbi:MAG TPA: hypothetical protein VF763_03825, partial [Candidatus Limnocylindrales bacterium]
MNIDPSTIVRTARLFLCRAARFADDRSRGRNSLTRCQLKAHPASERSAKPVYAGLDPVVGRMGEGP